MNVLIGIIFIIGCIYVGWTYGQMLLENRRLRQDIEELELEAGYCPKYQIFISDKNHVHIPQLFEMCIKAHAKADIPVRATIAKEGCTDIWFENGDRITLFIYGSKMEKLDKKMLEDSVTRVFMDYELPDSAIRACIEDLGLRNYLIGFGLCDKTQGGK